MLCPSFCCNEHTWCRFTNNCLMFFKFVKIQKQILSKVKSKGNQTHRIHQSWHHIQLKEHPHYLGRSSGCTGR